MNLNWIKTNQNSWHSLMDLNLDHPYFNDRNGVYIIWHWTSNANEHNIVRVGQGHIKSRLSEHRNNRQILSYGFLYVTWAELDMAYADRVENYLATKLNPKVGERFPNVQPLIVNIPE
ncbi:MAG TPA: hypothetical protein VLB73_00480 [Patescibacteria group bacterium]|nr:hypothetical protein [Patescibacteria group bacterium]